MKPFNFVVSTLISVFFLAGCASYDYEHGDRNQYVTEFYAQVEQVYPIKFDSEVGEAAVAWGLWGALENSHGDRGDILGGAIVGALLGGAITSLFEGSNQGYEYYLRAVDGDQVIVVLDHFPADAGECVRVRMSRNVKVYATSHYHCEQDLSEY
ncbi:MAG: hypothetical protein Alis3KO_11970 [Aliiglaciecola sp.]|uniref:hypothetical protein n=1 Tax=Aliiglaciecola sp. M165 TaxID=2593649 RepID=UPI0011813EC7|nr:hypothetical protein [Aliiglaciecola sp. M165]TRY31854.1 hypothetical protein FM019_08400 [Aliiglaciecola sp. M165]